MKTYLVHFICSGPRGEPVEMDVEQDAESEHDAAECMRETWERKRRENTRNVNLPRDPRFRVTDVRLLYYDVDRSPYREEKKAPWESQ